MASTDGLRWLLAGSLAIALIAAVARAEAQVMRQDTAVLDGVEGKSTAFSAKGGQPIKLLKRQGFWVQIEAAGKTGWVKVSAVNFSGGVAGPTAIDTGRLGKGNIVATSASRGLSAKDLLNGTPRPEELPKMVAFSAMADAATVQAFVAQGGIQAPAQPVTLQDPLPPAREVTTPAKRSSVGGAPPSGGTTKKDSDDW